MAVFGLYGTGGFAREVMPVVFDTIQEMGNLLPASLKIVFVEDKPCQSLINNIAVISVDDFFQMHSDDLYFNIAVADSKVREKLANQCLKNNVKPLTLKSRTSSAYISEIGDGAILCAHTIITANAKIGKFFHSNIYSYVAHDCIIGDYVTFAPRVNCNGNVHIGNGAYIGTAVIIKQGTPSKPLIIGENAVIGMGAVVTKDVAPGVTVVGNPARPLAPKT